MASIAKQVWALIDEDHAIRKDLARGIINVSALANYLKKHHAIKASIDSLISAIRRYKGREDFKNEQAAIKKAVHESVINTKNGLTMVSLKNSANLYKYISELMKEPDFYRSEVFRLIKGRNETICMIDRESISKARTFFPEGNIVKVRRGIAEIQIVLTEEGWKSKGVLASIANELASHGVNIIVIASGEFRIRFYLLEEDLPKAHAAVLHLAQS